MDDYRPSPARLLNWLIGCCWLTAVIFVAPSASAAESIEQARQSLEAEIAAAAGTLASWCDEKQLPEQAAITRGWLAPVDPRMLRIVDLPARDQAAAGSPDAAEWRHRWRALQQNHAKQLFTLAQRAVDQKDFSTAADLLRQTLWADPTHLAAWKALGCSDPSRQQRPKAQQKKKGVWQIETQHYRITSTHGADAGLQLAEELEFLYRAWRQVFFPYVTGESKPAKAEKLRRHEVYFFRDVQEYQRELKGAVPAGFVTTGIYLGDQKTAYFYPAPPGDNTTLYHEATHQLFSESRPVVPDIGADANFWAIEGAACYMESLTRRENYCTVGGIDNDRFRAARAHLIDENFYVPLAELTQFGMEKLQRDERIAKIYSQSAALTHFLMHAEGGQYRDGLMRYLIAIYTGRADTKKLAELTGEPYATLDEQYQAFIRTAPEEEEAQPGDIP